MARFNVSGLDDIISEMKALHEESGEAAKAMLMTGAEKVRDAWKRAADEYDHRVTGDMINSIGFAREPKDINGIKSIDIYPQGKDRKGVRNAEKAFILHYGSSKLEGSRWVDAADQYSEEEAIPAMIKVWEQFLDKGRVD